VKLGRAGWQAALTHRVFEILQYRGESMSKSNLSERNLTLRFTSVVALLSLICLLIFLHNAGQPVFAQASGTTQVYGGNGGNAFTDPLIPTGGRVTAVQIRAGDRIDSVQFTYSLPNGTTTSGIRHGGSGGETTTFQLDDEEYIVGLSGKYGDTLDSLCIITNKRTSQVFGGGGGDRDYQISVPSGNQAVGFAGRAGDYLDAIGLVYMPVQTLQPLQTTLAGGGGGSPFADKEMAQGARISEIRVRAGDRIDGIQAIYTMSNGRVFEGAWHGGQGGKLSVFRLDSNEYIIGLSGRAGDQVDSLRIITNKRTSIAFGGGGGSRAYRIDVPSGTRATGFAGRVGDRLDAIGLTYSSSSTPGRAQRILWPRRTN
jgi:hypothetical protein